MADATQALQLSDYDGETDEEEAAEKKPVRVSFVIGLLFALKNCSNLFEGVYVLTESMGFPREVQPRSNPVPPSFFFFRSPG